jgi:uncharacterized membrane protein YkvA (DUF1232 family)
MGSKFKVTFTLDEADADYFRTLYRKAKKGAADLEPENVIREARDIVARVRASKKTPSFVVDAISVLADLTDLIQDEDYAAPKDVSSQVLTAIAYFSNPQDLIPDHIPGLGYLDDAIMVKFIEEEFKHELWGYRKFCKLRDESEQRPWSSAGRGRLQKRLAADRKKIRAEIANRGAKDSLRKRARGRLGW